MTTAKTKAKEMRVCVCVRERNEREGENRALWACITITLYAAAGTHTQGAWTLGKSKREA